MTRYLLAPVRCLAATLMSVAGLALALLATIGAIVVVGYPAAAVALRRFGQLGRWVSVRWGGIEITNPPTPPPPEPVRRHDGWYVYDKQLFRRRWLPALMLRLEALSDNSRFTREWGWLVLTPLTGGFAVAVPLVLIAAGVAVAVDPVTALALAGRTASGALAEYGWRAAGVALVVAGFALGPAALRLFGVWNRILLRPPEESWWRRSGFGAWIMRGTRAAWAAAALVGISLGACVLGLIGTATVVVTLGWTAPFVAVALRPYLRFYRCRMAAWAATEIPQPYLPYPPPPPPGEDGLYRHGRQLYPTQAAAIKGQRYGWLLKDPASWRDLLWMVTAPLTAPISLAPAALVAVGFFGLTWQAAWWAPWAVPLGLSTGVWVSPWYTWYAVSLLWTPLQSIPGWVSVLVGLAMAGIGLVLAEPILRLRCWADRSLLGPTRGTLLAQRVHQLAETRADTLDAQAAELRRIERDLHDGAQARLIAVGLSLATVEQLMQSDPTAAKALLAQARESSATALAELRALVRGIHPPVLAERGLGDAVRAIALDTPLPVTVTVELPGRLAAPLESAAYFAICEALANATRHAGAAAVEVGIHYRDGMLRVTVADDGRGGADPDRGTGLRGMRRRLASFDATLHIDSPPGGPTVLTMEIPCALSSPRTSTSSETA